VVFSQLRDALAHAAEALTWEGLGCALVGVRPAGSNIDAAAESESAIARFREDPDVKVLLLHAAGPGGYCSPRHMMSLNSTAGRPWKAQAM
jgi:hypothetical protein